jgi:hypothetical protein
MDLGPKIHFMESLAVLVAIIVFPAMFGGPFVLALSLWRLERSSLFRRVFMIIMASLSTLIGLYLLSGGFSRGGVIIGILGVITGLLTIYRSTILFRKIQGNQATH